MTETTFNPNLRFVPTLTEVLSSVNNSSVLASISEPTAETFNAQFENLESLIEARIHDLAPQLAALIVKELKPILLEHSS